MHITLDKNWYSQLKHIHTAYRNVTPIQILNHLDSQWCLLDIQARKQIKLDYYTEWDSEIHLTAFGKRLDDEQIRIERFGITISDEDKLQFYLEQMYSSNTFDKKEMTEWENKPEAVKSDFAQAKLYFEGLVKDYETYEQNSGGTTGKNKYDSALQTREANKGDKLREFIAKIATAAVARKEIHDKLTANLRNSATAKSNEFEAMALQIKHSPTSSRSSPRTATKKTIPTSPKEEALASKSNTPSHAQWAPTVGLTDFTQQARITQAQHARGKRKAMTSPRHDQPATVDVSTGQSPSA